jgi:hypothetical protein
VSLMQLPQGTVRIYNNCIAAAARRLLALSTEGERKALEEQNTKPAWWSSGVAKECMANPLTYERPGEGGQLEVRTPVKRPLLDCAAKHTSSRASEAWLSENHATVKALAAKLQAQSRHKSWSFRRCQKKALWSLWHQLPADEKAVYRMLAFQKRGVAAKDDEDDELTTPEKKTGEPHARLFRGLLGQAAVEAHVGTRKLAGCGGRVAGDVLRPAGPCACARRGGLALVGARHAARGVQRHVERAAGVDLGGGAGLEGLPGPRNA